MYHIGETEEDRIIADRVFLNNMIRIVTEGTTNRWLMELRLRRCSLYFAMVRDRGGPAFWNDKNKEEEFQLSQ
jgi:hypothetical protein